MYSTCSCVLLLLSNESRRVITILSSMYENSSPSRGIYQYETVPSASPTRSFYENNVQQSYYESNLPPITHETTSSLSTITPPFQKKLPVIPMITLGSAEILGGLIVLVLEIFVFDIAIGLWCGLIYILAGVAAIVLVIGTDRERHQTSAVLIFQFVALMFTITEIVLHSDFYQKRCVTKPTEPSREASYQCQILLIQIGGAAFVLLSSCLFISIYCRVTMMVLKQPHGTFNISNAMNFSC